MNRLKGILLLAVALMAACATSPTGRTQLMLVSEEQAIASSKAAYLSEMKRLGDEGKLSTDIKLNARIREITGRLVAQAIIMRPDSAEWEWSVEVIDEPDTVNAWCMAGGRMAIYTGLIDKTEATDDEIAQVMGHEIAHALANHTAERMSVAMAAQVGVLAVAVGTQDARYTAAATSAALLALTLPNSRTSESEADEIGIELAAKAGYDPRAAVTLWQKMAKAGGGRPPEFLSTHPAPENRQERLAAMIPRMQPYYESVRERPTYRLEQGDYGP